MINIYIYCTSQSYEFRSTLFNRIQITQRERIELEHFRSEICWPSRGFQARSRRCVRWSAGIFKDTPPPRYTFGSFTNAAFLAKRHWHLKATTSRARHKNLKNKKIKRPANAACRSKTQDCVRM